MIVSIKGDVLPGGINQEIQGVTTQTRAHPDDFNPNVLKPLLDNDVTMSKQLEKIADASAKILTPNAFKATDEGGGYPLGVSMFYFELGISDGWPVNNGQVVTFRTNVNRITQIVSETNTVTPVQRTWTRRWSNPEKSWSEFRELETTAGSKEKADAALAAAKQYTDDTAKILPSMSYKATDEGSLYPKGMTMFWINSGKADGWPADNGQIVTWYLAQNRLSQFFLETDVRSLRMWLRRWSDNQKIWTDFLELETTIGSQQKADDVLSAAKDYVNVLRADVDSNTDEIAKFRVAIDELKKSGVDAKNRIAGAINAKGVPASASDTWPTLASKIDQIHTGTAGGSHTATMEFNIASKQQGVEHVLFSQGPPPNIKKIRTIHYAAMDLEKSRFYSEATGDFVRLYLEDNAGIRWRLASSLLAGLKDVYILSWYITLDDGPGLYPKAYVKFLDGYKTESNITNPPKGFNLDGSIKFVVTAYQQNSASTVTAALAGWVVYSWKEQADSRS